jgi:hypothetical protein
VAIFLSFLDVPVEYNTILGTILILGIVFEILT